MENTVRLKRFVVVFVGLILLITLASSVWHYLHTGSISVTTDSKESYITLTRVANNSEGVTVEPLLHSKGSLSASLKTGQYILRIQDQRADLVSKAVTISSRHKSIYSFKFPAIGFAEPVVKANGHDFAVSENQIQYLDTDSSKINKIDEQNLAPTTYSDQLFESVQWADPDYGIGHGSDGQFYEILGSTVKKISLPTVSLSARQMTFSLAPDRRLYISVGKDIYSGFVKNGLKKIYSTDVSAPYLSASSDNLAIIALPTYGDAEKDQPTYVETVSKYGKQMGKKDLGATSASWSPDGNKLTVVGYGEGSGVYDARLGLVAMLPGNSIQTSVWANNDTVLYAAGKTLWSYSLDKSQATALAIANAGKIGEISVDKEQAYAYLATSIDSGATISRVGLKGQKVDDSVRNLDIALPADLDQCTVGYSNFVHHAIVAYPYSATLAGSCKQAAIALMQEYKIDVSKLEFVVSLNYTKTN